MPGGLRVPDAWMPQADARHRLPVCDGVGPSCIALPPGPWATIGAFLIERFSAVPVAEWHARMAAALEKRLSDTIAARPELLAHHLTEAGRPAQAVGYWLAAGNNVQAEARWSPEPPMSPRFAPRWIHEWTRRLLP